MHKAPIIAGKTILTDENKTPNEKATSYIMPTFPKKKISVASLGPIPPIEIGNDPTRILIEPIVNIYIKGIFCIDIKTKYI